METRHILAALAGIVAISAGVALDAVILLVVGFVAVLYGISRWA